MEWVEALLLAYEKDYSDHETQWVVEAAQTMDEMDLMGEEAFQSRKLLHCPVKS
jgi:hypothetical protein